MKYTNDSKSFVIGPVGQVAAGRRKILVREGFLHFALGVFPLISSRALPFINERKWIWFVHTLPVPKLRRWRNNSVLPNAAETIGSAPRRPALRVLPVLVGFSWSPGSRCRSQFRFVCSFVCLITLFNTLGLTLLPKTRLTVYEIISKSQMVKGTKWKKRTPGSSIG